jgi:VCBS repeat-containing protein
MEKITKQKLNLNNHYSYANGTDQFVKYGNFLLTDTVHNLAKENECYWLLDVITSWQYHIKVRNEGFQVWTLERIKDEKFRVKAEDGNGNKIAVQIIEYSDFQSDILTLWLVEGTILLPSEY